MKNTVLYITFFFCLFLSAHTTTAQHKVCCACNGVGRFSSTRFIPGTTIPETVTVYCQLCWGTGAGDCRVKPIQSPDTPQVTRAQDTKIYLDYLTKVVGCRCRRAIPTPDEFWRTRPDLNLPRL